MQQIINDFLKHNKNWQIKDDKLHRQYKFSNFIEAFAFMNEMALFAESNNHHPEWFNVYNQVIVDLTTHDVGGISQKDIVLATQMEKVASQKLRH